MTTKAKRLAAEKAAREAQQRPPMGMITPPEVVAGLLVRHTIGEDIKFGRCSHALQLLPNQTILLLVTSEGDDGGTEVDTFLVGEEVSSFKALKSMIETADGED